jgi:hypothetical protein
VARLFDTERCLPSKSFLRVTKDIGKDVADAVRQGHRFVFTNDLALERYDDSTYKATYKFNALDDTREGSSHRTRAVLS